MSDETAASPDWEAVDRDYLDGMKIVALCTRHAITKGQFDGHRRRVGLPMRNKAPVKRERLVGRIFWLVNHHIREMEKKTDAGGEIDVAVLNQLVGALGRLMRFESGSSKAQARRQHAADLLDIREKLVRRIEELKRN
ncbi:MAG: hypothetical protein JNL14_01085 [Devosia sp.]|uniref:hypothetical protein n=1 Tax=Devosia sp. TaxID=1871048 RepID=UPI001A4C7CA7|nr:hypothetical protein [Devosia sp.]MBL8596312.1 hypothetical protein [Devosia sp.]